MVSTRRVTRQKSAGKRLVKSYAEQGTRKLPAKKLPAKKLPAKKRTVGGRVMRRKMAPSSVTVRARIVNSDEESAENSGSETESEEEVGVAYTVRQKTRVARGNKKTIAKKKPQATSFSRAARASRRERASDDSAASLLLNLSGGARARAGGDDGANRDEDDEDDADDDDDDHDAKPKNQNSVLNKNRRRFLLRRAHNFVKLINTTFACKPWWPQFDLMLVAVNQFKPNIGGLQKLPGKRKHAQVTCLVKNIQAHERLNEAMNGGSDSLSVTTAADFLDRLMMVAEEDA